MNGLLVAYFSVKLLRMWGQAAWRKLKGFLFGGAADGQQGVQVLPMEPGEAGEAAVGGTVGLLEHAVVEAELERKAGAGAGELQLADLEQGECAAAEKEELRGGAPEATPNRTRSANTGVEGADVPVVTLAAAGESRLLDLEEGGGGDGRQPSFGGSEFGAAAAACAPGVTVVANGVAVEGAGAGAGADKSLAEGKAWSEEVEKKVKRSHGHGRGGRTRDAISAVGQSMYKSLVQKKAPTHQGGALAGAAAGAASEGAAKAAGDRSSGKNHQKKNRHHHQRLHRNRNDHNHKHKHNRKHNHGNQSHQNHQKHQKKAGKGSRKKGGNDKRGHHSKR